MIDHRFDAIARHSASVLNRRASLQVLGTTALIAAVTRPAMAQAKMKTGKNIKRKGQRQAQQCLVQVGQCRAFFAGACESPDSGECEARIARCCEFLGSCDAASFLSCVFGAA